MTERIYERVSDTLLIPKEEIIRCKNCEFRRFNEDEEFYYCALEDRPNRNWSVNITDFCSWAERREE